MAAKKLAALLSFVPVSIGVNVQSLQASHVPPKGVNPARIAELEKEWRKKHNISAPQVETQKKVRSLNSKRVYITHGNRKDEPVTKYMYEPFVKTIEAGFSANPDFEVVVADPAVEFRSELETYSTNNLVSGDILIFIGGVGKGTFLDVAGSEASLMRETRSASQQSAQAFRDYAKRNDFAKLKLQGVIVIYYNTDAGFECALTAADPVTEMWDYSHHNIDVCEESHNGPTTRFVPPGYIGPNEPTVVTSGPVGSLMHLGHAWWRTCWLQLYNHIPGELAFESSAWTDAAFQGILKHHSIFLNLHKGECGWERNPFAAARASRILSAGGILISEKAYGKDETAFGSVVNFTTFETIPTVYANYQQMTSTAFDTERQRIAGIYQTNFAPSVIFANAGIYDDLR